MLQQLKNYYHLVQSVMGKMRYYASTEGITFIGVTGTDGKTTTSNLLYHILTESGINAAVISTVSAKIGGEEVDTGFHVTTPGPMQVRKYMQQAVRSGASHIVLEVTSHALDQNRVYGIPFRIGVLTNITEEHLDYHKTYTNYVQAKVRLLRQSRIAIINRDDASYLPVTAMLKKVHYSGLVKTYGIHKEADLTPDKFSYTTKLIGDFNTANILAAASVCLELGLERKIITKAIASYTPPLGRTEIVYADDFTVMIDFAHTPNSIFQLLTALRQTKNYRKIIHVFGSAGERDRYKRPLMGKNSAEFADVIIITAEDPRSESVSGITSQIREGVNRQLAESERKVDVHEVPDRQDAITRAIQLAAKGDIVVITGKGHERSMTFGNSESPWNEHAAVKVALEQKGVDKPKT